MSDPRKGYVELDPRTNLACNIFIFERKFCCAYPSKFDVPRQDVGRHATKTFKTKQTFSLQLRTNFKKKFPDKGS